MVWYIYNTDKMECDEIRATFIGIVEEKKAHFERQGHPIYLYTPSYYVTTQRTQYVWWYTGF